MPLPRKPLRPESVQRTSKKSKSRHIVALTNELLEGFLKLRTRALITKKDSQKSATTYICLHELSRLPKGSTDSFCLAASRMRRQSLIDSLYMEAPRGDGSELMGFSVFLSRY